MAALPAATSSPYNLTLLITSALHAPSEATCAMCSILLNPTRLTLSHPVPPKSKQWAPCFLYYPPAVRVPLVTSL